MPEPLTSPLAGIRVIDLTSVLFGPYATQMLGDFGADVIKIEAPGGDPTRGIGPARNPGMAAGFLGCNRNKRSVCLDLKRAPARAALWRLIDGADVFVHNIRPQKIAALGFTADDVMARKANIVYGAFHGYLESGPYAGRPAYDDVIQGESGIAAAFLARDGEPAFAPSVIADKSAGLIAANGLIAALFQRLRTGKGVYMEIGMFESMVAYTLLEHQFGAIFDPPEGTPGYSRLISAERKPYATSDGYICMLPYTDQHWRAFWDLAGTPEMADDPRYRTLADRTRNIDTLYASTGAALAARSTNDWLTALRKAEIPCGPINGFADLKHDPHLQAVGMFRAFEHPSEGALDLLDSGLRLDREPLPVRQHQPTLGEHGIEVLREAGLDGSEISAALDTGN
ncbi:MAG: CaiB/BaiF CoA transferase family protein [Gammaproteobacteria bacterium]|jgi:crotonobetainyl-CoA:carnitine CoA-transferase CaiB-like acyl-CoA transferase